MNAAATTDTAKKLPVLLKKLKGQYKPETPVPRDGTMQIITAFFQWEASTPLAEEALDHLFTNMIDVNELRVTPDAEIIRIVGDDYPIIAERVRRMRDVLNNVFMREHTLDMRNVAAQGKKEQKAYLETLPAIPSYVVSSVALLAFGIHAIPVDRQLTELLEAEGVIDPGMAPGDVESLLLRHVKASDAADTHMLFQAWADESNTGKHKPKKK